MALFAALLLFQYGNITFASYGPVSKLEIPILADHKYVRKLYDDGLVVVPPQAIKPAHVQTYDDHRMAMSLSLACLVTDGVVVSGVECVRKTFPDYFDRLTDMCARP